LTALGSVKVRPAVPSLGILALQLALQKERESVERDIGHVMLDALGIEFRALLGDTDGAQKIDNEPMPGADAIGETMSLRRQEHAAVELRCGKPLALEAGDRLDRGRMGDAQPAGDIGRARLSAASKEIVDQFDVILKDRCRLSRTRFFKAPRLHRLNREFDGRLWCCRRFRGHLVFVPWRHIRCADRSFEKYELKSITKSIDFL